MFLAVSGGYGGARGVNLSVRAMVLSTFYHNTLMKQRKTVPENCDEYERRWVICCIIVTKVTRQVTGLYEVLNVNPFHSRLQKRTCWTDADRKERFVTVLRATKNRGLRVNRQLVR